MHALWSHNLNKDYALLSSIRRFGTVPGGNAFQKINYFANLRTDLFMYAWRNWGPFSPEVRQFFDDAHLDKVISVEEQKLANSAPQYNIRLAEGGVALLQSLGREEKLDREALDGAVDFAWGLLNGKNPRQMEIMASVHYINSYDKPLEVQKIWEIICMLKPYADFTPEDVTYALSNLADVQPIQKAA